METQEIKKPNGAPPPEAPKEQPRKTLVQKLSEIVSVIDHVEKSGRNDFQKYNYVKAADVAWLVRKALCERNVYLVSDVVSVRNYEIPAREGVMQAVDVQMEFSFHDGDAPETTPIVLHSYGTGTDKGDKAIYKAMTGALKYGLRHAFLIPDESDPEADTKTDKATAAQEVGKRKVRELKEQMEGSLAVAEAKKSGVAALFYVWDNESQRAEITGDFELKQKCAALLKPLADRHARAYFANADQLEALKWELDKLGVLFKQLQPGEKK